MTNITTNSLVATMTLLNDADSLMPRYNTHVTATVMSTAKRSKPAPVTENTPDAGSKAQKGWSMPDPTSVPPHRLTNCLKCCDQD